jgi:anti-anti-sigma regulatory factor
MKNIKQLKIDLVEYTGTFAENKDTARKIREELLIPALNAEKNIVLDFSKVNTMTQSFTHALISDLIRSFGEDFFDKVSFKSCSPSVRRIINIVAEYMQKTHKN